MDAVSVNPPDHLKIPRPLSPSPRRVVFLKPTQIGGSEVGWNLTGYVIHHAPGPELIVLPTLPMARKVSKNRLTPMIRESPELSARIRLATKESGNTLLEKEFEGGSVALAGSNAATGLKQAAIRYLIGDEVDEWPGDVEGQGDPVKLAEKRLSSYGRRAIAYYVSTPTIKGVSRIEKLFVVSDQRRYFVPCPSCGHMDHLQWKNLIWEEGKPDSARLQCSECGELIEERWKTWMMDPANGAEWRSTAPAGHWDGETVGFHLNGLYMPLGWSPSWGQAVRDWLESQQDPSKLKTFVNTFLAETYEERGEGAEPEQILARAERYAAEVPNGVGYLVAAVDVQGDRLEAIVKGYGAAEESWLIAHQVFIGNPDREDVWFELDQWLLEPFLHESGQEVHIGIVTIDSNYLSDTVYKFVKARARRKIAPTFAVRGGNELGKALVATTSMHRGHRVRIYTLCTDTGKNTISKRLTIGLPSAGSHAPGYMHMPEWVTLDYLNQLTAEKKLPTRIKGKGTVYRWEKIRDRNEALDLEVYALAGLYIRGDRFVNKELALRAARLARKDDGVAPVVERPAPVQPASARPPRLPRPRIGWVGRFRR